MDADQLFADHQHLACATAQRLARRLSRRVDPDELFTAALVGLWNAVQRFDPHRVGVRFATYAQHRIRGEIFDWLRITRGRRRSDLKLPPPCVLKEGPASPADTGQRLLECRDLVDFALRAVTGRQRQAVELYYLEGLPGHVVAERLSCTQGNVSLLLKAARERMREQLAGKEMP